MKSPRRDSVVPSEPRLLRLLEGPDRSAIRSSHGFGETLSADFRWGSFSEHHEIRPAGSAVVLIPREQQDNDADGEDELVQRDQGGDGHSHA